VNLDQLQQLKRKLLKSPNSPATRKETYKSSSEFSNNRRVELQKNIIKEEEKAKSGR
jgi:hypothetical protein